jgi:V/A-type H+-transporting ATPase subunit I
MVRVRIQVPGRAAAALTHAIARAGLLHLIDITHGRLDSTPAGSRVLLEVHCALRDRLRRTLDRLGRVAPPLAPAPDGAPINDFDVERQRVATTLEPIEAAVNAAWSARDSATAAAAATERTRERAAALQRGGADAGGLADMRFARAIVVSAGEEALAALSTFLSPTPHRIETVDGSALAIVAAPASAQTRLDAALRLVHVEAVPIAEVAASRLPALTEALTRARHDTAAAVAALEELARVHAATLVALLSRADLCALLLQAQERFGATGRFVVIAGWIPECDVPRLRAAVSSAAPDAVLDVEAPWDGAAAGPGMSGVPILHRNPVLLRPFQSLIELYDTPSYGEVQPTAFFGISFLLMFGLMFGDVGHGAILAAAGYYLFRYMPRYLDYGILLMETGVASIGFGFLYGSLFGIEGALPVLWLEPVRDLPTFMRIAVGLGVALVSIGLILNVFNSWRLGQRASALFSIHGLFGAFVYWTAVALLVRVMMPTAMVVPAWLLWTLALAAAALIAVRGPLVRRLSRSAPTRATGPPPPRWLRALEGSIELVDALVAYFANTVSFIRIAAFAAVHAGVFIAMFAVSDTLAQTRLGQPLAIAALVAGNILVILLEGLTVSIQVLRLEYYEFFGKFFRGGGVLYRPLMLQPSHNPREGAARAGSRRAGEASALQKEGGAP